MHYDMPLFRPPSEAASLIFQVTLGCSWNRCRFCSMYHTKKYTVRPWGEIKHDILEMARQEPRTRRIFLADGDALAAPTDHLLKVLDLINFKFPELEGVSSYVGGHNLLEKSADELKQLRARKLDLLYLGVESGNDDVLTLVNKGVSAGDMIAGADKVREANMGLCTIILLGLGGVRLSRAHAADSARIINRMDPRALGCLTLAVGHDAARYEQQVMGDGFKLLDRHAVLQEMRWIVEDLDLTRCTFNTEHATNHLPLSGSLPRDKERILDLLDGVLDGRDERLLRPDLFRQTAPDF